MNTRTTLIDNEYACLWYYPDDGIIHHKFLQPISDELFRNVLMTGLKILREQGAQKWLSDDRNNSILQAEDSAWSQDYWLPRAIDTNWRYWALLEPEKKRARINMDRLMGFVRDNTRVKVEIFPDPDEARQWLIRQGKEK
ncbi:MAG: hypothetical protein P8179_24845 [Candidatus Thiodiazotropha sp.]|jgi:hypothetical protein